MEVCMRIRSVQKEKETVRKEDLNLMRTKSWFG